MFLLTCTNSKKKFRLKFVPLTTYLFATVIRILLTQYVPIEMTGLFAIDAIEAACEEGGGGGLGGGS